MNLPLILLSGPAGSGKDTIASFLVKNHGAMALGFADPMKRFAQNVFMFDDNQLWGPSSARNAVDERFKDLVFRCSILRKLEVRSFVQDFIHDILPNIDEDKRYSEYKNLYHWVDNFLDTCKDGLTPRRMLQTFGTEYGRNLDRNVWVNIAVRDAKLLLSGNYRYDRKTGPVFDKTYAGPEWVVVTDGRFRNEIIELRSLGAEAWKIISAETDASAVEKAGVVGHLSEAEQKTIPNHFFTAIVENDKSKGLAYAEKLVRYTMIHRAGSPRVFGPSTVHVFPWEA